VNCIEEKSGIWLAFASVRVLHRDLTGASHFCCFFSFLSEWLWATITSAHPSDRTYDVIYDDGEMDEAMPLKCIV
jgi:hypothetical protein